jgi:hypothetical protein
MKSTQLTVLAAPAIEAALAPAGIARGLSLDAGSDTRQRATACFDNRLTAFVTIWCTLAGRHTPARFQHRIAHGVVDLILHRAIARPAARHQ